MPAARRIDSTSDGPRGRTEAPLQWHANDDGRCHPARPCDRRSRSYNLQTDRRQHQGGRRDIGERTVRGGTAREPKGMNPLVFSTSPTVVLSTNRFRDVPVVLQYEQTPLIEVVREVGVGFDVQAAIYHPDGTYLAKVKGSRLFLTEAGKKAGLTLRHPDKRTVCELDGQTLLEIQRHEAAALNTHAALYTPDGSLIKCSDNPRPDLIRAGKNALQVGGILMAENLIVGCRIGVWIKADGSCSIGCS